MLIPPLLCSQPLIYNSRAKASSPDKMADATTFWLPEQTISNSRRQETLRVHLPSGLQRQKSATRLATKLLVSNCKTSAEKSGNFTAEVGEVLLYVFLIPRKEVVFASYLVCKNRKV
jgi:hypothetical protein